LTLPIFQLSEVTLNVALHAYFEFIYMHVRNKPTFTSQIVICDNDAISYVTVLTPPKCVRSKTTMHKCALLWLRNLSNQNGQKQTDI